MAYKKTKKKLNKAEELTLAKNQWNSKDREDRSIGFIIYKALFYEPHDP